MTSAFTSLFRTQKPKFISSDMGKEFLNNRLQKFFAENNVKHFINTGKHKASLAERVIRTIKNRLYRLFTKNGNHVWDKYIQDFAHSYNNSVHSTLKMTPHEATLKKNYKTLINSQKKRIKDGKIRVNFKVGDTVRISKLKKVFDKEHDYSWSEELFVVSHIDRKVPPVMYTIVDLDGNPIQGKFYNEELQEVFSPNYYAVEKVLEKRGNQYLVKFLGYKQPSWVNNIDVISKVL